MKKIQEKKVVETEIVEVEGEGLEKLLGQNVLIMCMNYSYAGKLIGVNKTFVLLEDAGIVFETGPFGDAKFKDFQKFPVKEWHVSTGAIESYGLSNK